jgi:hypothetical protein
MNLRRVRVWHILGLSQMDDPKNSSTRNQRPPEGLPPAGVFVSSRVLSKSGGPGQGGLT